MGAPPKVIMTDGEGAIKHNGLFFKKYCTEHHLTYIQSRGHPVFAERMIRPFSEMLDKRIKLDQYCPHIIISLFIPQHNLHQLIPEGNPMNI